MRFGGPAEECRRGILAALGSLPPPDRRARWNGEGEGNPPVNPATGIYPDPPWHGSPMARKCINFDDLAVDNSGTIRIPSKYFQYMRRMLIALIF